MDVDESRSDDQAAGVDHAPRRPRRARLDRDDAATGDADVGIAGGRAGAVDEVTAADGQVVHGA